MSQPPVLFLEKKVREKLRISRDQFRRIRTEELELKEGAEVRTLDGRGATALTERGLSRVIAWLRETQPELHLPSDYGDCSAGDSGTKNGQLDSAHDLLVTRVLPNRRLVRCVMAAEPDGAAVMVRVPDNRNFMPKMKLRARVTEGGYWQLVGRCPRHRGRY